ncbi:MAG: ComF family protein [Lawsonibacter sp.]|jgi:competence protein ComFC
MNMWTDILDLVFPPKCPFCRRLLKSGEEGLCNKCQVMLPWCLGGTEGRKIAGAEGCYAPLAYDGKVPEAIHRYKFAGLRCYANTFGHLMAQCAQDRIKNVEGIDGITWAPLSRKRLWERGYDQAKCLAEQVSRELAVPVYPTLRKIRNTKPQSELEGDQLRRKNAAGAYELQNDIQLTEKSFILVDDVVTSGATLETCVGLLREAGVKQVWCLTLAQAGKERRERKN